MTDEILWTKEITLELIGLYEMQPNLYNPSDPDYIHRGKRIRSLLLIVDGLKDIAPNLTVDSVKRKLHTLRNQFIREFRLMEKSKKSGADLKDIYRPKLWCFEQLFFLKSYCFRRNYLPSIEKRKVPFTSILKSVEKTALTMPISSTPQASTNVHSNAPVIVHPNIPATSISKALEKVTDLLEKRATNKSSYDWLGKQVVFEMGNIQDERIKRNASWEIQKILRQSVEEDLALRNGYSPSSTITSNRSTSEKCNPSEEMYFKDEAYM